MVGMSLPAPIIERFQESLDQGEYLIIIDIKSQEDHIDFEWVNLDKISEVNLLPDGIKEFLNA
jgi:hypothetical protein